MDGRDLMTLRNRYEAERYVVIRGLLSPDVLDVVVAYAHILGATDRFLADPAIGRSMSCYGDAGFDALLVSHLLVVSQIVGVELAPTYSFARVYRRGDELRRHRDRVACEHSASIHLDSSGGTWPMELARVDGSTEAAILAPGDAVLYRGIELPHWRTPCPTDWYLQVFLHWVETSGRHADEAFDRRAGLGRPDPRTQDGVA